MPFIFLARNASRRRRSRAWENTGRYWLCLRLLNVGRNICYTVLNTQTLGEGLRVYNLRASEKPRLFPQHDSSRISVVLSRKLRRSLVSLWRNIR